MLSTDTICALATAPGIAGLAVVRVSGSNAFQIVDKIFKGKIEISNAATHTIHYGKLALVDDVIDAVTVSVFKAPHSYTGEDVAEIGCHGGVAIPDLVIRSLLLHGARHAGPGEFSKRAFINGKMDLTQVESVADIIHAASSSSTSIATKQLFGSFRDTIVKLRKELIDTSALLELELDFAHEGIELINRQRIESAIGECVSFCESMMSTFKSSMQLRTGFKVGLVGRPNAGKSLLFNELLKWSRSIVHDSVGTTRDFIQESVIWDGMHFIICDTAGMRSTSDEVESQGIALSASIIADSDLVLIVNDLSCGLDDSEVLYQTIKADKPDSAVFIVHNKLDIAENESNERTKDFVFFVSAKTKSGVEELRYSIIKTAKKSTNTVNFALLNQRHYDLLSRAKECLVSANIAYSEHEFNESVAYELRRAIDCLGEISGESFNEEVLQSIFANFCIGK